METVDRQKAARVWERVQAQPQSQPVQRLEAKALLGLIAGESADASAYLQLSRRFSGQQSATLRKLYEQEQSHVACLRGIYTLLTGEQPAVPEVQSRLESTGAALRRCYGREMQCLAAYEARRGDPEYGAVFARLAEREQEHCHILLTIIGSLPKGK